MKLNGTADKINILKLNDKTCQIELHLNKLPNDELLNGLIGCDLLDIEIKKHVKKRSLDANAYLWVLCDKIAFKIGTTQEEVYQKSVREVGRREMLAIKTDVVDRWLIDWRGRGLGWFSEIVRESDLRGYTVTRNYYGSSTYTTDEMKRLIDNIIDECNELGIDTKTPQEIEKLLKMIRR